MHVNNITLRYLTNFASVEMIMVLYGLRFVSGILFDQTFETFSFFCEIIYITKFVSESFFIFSVSSQSQIDFLQCLPPFSCIRMGEKSVKISRLRIRITLMRIQSQLFTFSADPDPDPCQSDRNLRPLV